MKKIEKTDAITVVIHWALVLSLLASLATGLRIAADNPDATYTRALSAVLLQGDVMTWHVWAAYALALIIAAYVVFILRARLGARIALDRSRLASLRSPDHRTRWKGINVLIFWMAFLLIIIATVTGTFLYYFPGGLPHAIVTYIHNLVAWILLGYVVVHITTQLIQGGIEQLLKIMNPRTAYQSAALTALVIAIVVGGGLYGLNQISTVDELVIAEAKAPPALDGLPSDDVWRRAPGVDIPTNRGMNNPGGEVMVTVKMGYHGDMLYALFQWPDSTLSRKHLPLEKTERGWRVVQTEFGIQDEDDYYEDKFGVMLAHTPELAGAGTSHLGPKPLSNRPGPAGGRGLHYTTDNSIVDVWHWKSVRTGSSAMRQIDDNYFGPPMVVNPKKTRYTGGYTQDPSSGGGYTMNWQSYDDDIIVPKVLPADPSVLDRLGKVDLTPTVSDSGEFWMSKEMTQPYSEEADQLYPVGTIMPSVLIKGPRQGDRGDVTAVGHWGNGYWTLEVARKLDTGSDYDIAIRECEPVYLWVAVFDHTQTRHSQHMHPIRIVMPSCNDPRNRS